MFAGIHTALGAEFCKCAWCSGRYNCTICNGEVCTILCAKWEFVSRQPSAEPVQNQQCLLRLKALQCYLNVTLKERWPFQFLKNTSDLWCRERCLPSLLRAAPRRSFVQ